jgi:histidinol phosphatase-like PHP family hydrolase
MEIDGHPDRQDLDVELLGEVRDAGGWVSIGTDAHHPSELRFMEYGLATAMLAGIPRERILNFLPLEDLRAWAGRIRG